MAVTGQEINPSIDNQPRDERLELSARLEEARELESTRIARAIHDDLGQALTGLKMDVAWLSRHLRDPQDILQLRLRSMSILIDEMVQSVRKIATELRPPVLDEIGLIEALEWHLQEFAQRTGIHSNYACELPELSLDEGASLAVFRIFQEALTNVARHSNATQVTVRLSRQDGHIDLEVRDNGRGISPAEVADPRSIGLIGMRERALLHGGDVTIQGSSGQGTRLAISMPLPPDGGKPPSPFFNG